MFSKLNEDLIRAISINKLYGFRIIYLFFMQEIWAILIYRFGSWIHYSFKIPVIKIVLKIFAFIAFKIGEILTGISIPFSVQIGRGFYITHFGGIVIHSNVKMGENCTLSTGVVIGNRKFGSTEVPVIGNNVFIGVGAKILGGIKIGDNVRIGANAVVLTDAPDNSTVVGTPAKVIKINL